MFYLTPKIYFLYFNHLIKFHVFLKDAQKLKKCYNKFVLIRGYGGMVDATDLKK